jgi:hypothetical protein
MRKDCHEYTRNLQEMAKAFYFLPRTALILLESSPPRSYRFPRGFTLHHIYQDLVCRYNKDSSDDPIFQILEILGMRDYLGIRLPDTIRDEVIKIGVPGLDTVPDDADDIPLAAWEVFNNANESLNVESWQDWYDLVQPNVCPSLKPDNSNLTVQEDAAELFGDFSWTLTTPGRYQGQSRRAHVRGHEYTKFFQATMTMFHVSGEALATTRLRSNAQTQRS